MTKKHYKIDFKIKYNDNEIYSRAGELNLNGKKIQTPSLWLGHCIGLPPEPWNKFHMDTLMVNAYEILKKPSAYDKICKKGIHNYLNFKGLIMMDSGGFLFQKKEEVDIHPAKIIELYEKAKPDIGVVLDHPFDPHQSDIENNRRWQETLVNTDFMIKNNGKIALMPVIHGYSLKELKKACDEIKKINENPKLIGLGSLVPLIFRTKKSDRFSNSINFILDSVKLVRQEFPDAFLHAFGIGSTKSMHLMYSIGVDSLDSTGWRIKAAYGNIQLPGVGDRHPTSRNNGRPFLNPSEKKILDNCICPTCKGKNIQEKISALDGNFQDRALHNAWVFVNEHKMFQDYLSKGRSKYFAKKRLEKGFFSKSFQYLIQEKESEKLERWI